MRRTLLIEPCPSHRVRPAEPHRPIALVTRAGRRALPAERVAGVQSPQALVVTYPWRLVIDEYRAPPLRLAWSHAGTVTPVVVDEREAKRGAAVRPGPRQEQPTEAVQPGEHPSQRRGLDGDQVIARKAGARMRPGADEDDRVGVPPAQVGIVEPAAQIVAGFVMRGKRDPGRPLGCDRRVW